MIYPKFLIGIYKTLEVICRGSGVVAGKSGRHMKYPYTISAKIAQFPYFFYMKNQFIWMYYPIGLAASFYAFAKIHFLANSPENQRNWAETQRRNAAKEHH